MNLLFYDEVMRGVEALIRERGWSLLITYLREDENPGATPQEDEPVCRACRRCPARSTGC